MQDDLFLNNKEPRDILTKDGLAKYYPSAFFDSENLFNKLHNELPWKQDQITLYGKTHNIPRLQCFIGSPNLNYSYSGIKLTSSPWTKTLLEIKKQVETISMSRYNCVLCNLYLQGSDYVAWHSDDEPELGPNPTISSVSLGGEREFELKNKYNKTVEKINLTLESGSLLVMSGPLQHNWLHQIKKTKRTVGPRINLTFRNIISL